VANATGARLTIRTQANHVHKLAPLLPHLARCTLNVPALGDVPWAELDNLWDVDVLRIRVTHWPPPPPDLATVKVQIENHIRAGHMARFV
jgi:hypothetical protein